MAKEFGKSLSAGLIRTKWNDECSAAIVWAGKKTKINPLHKKYIYVFFSSA